LKEQMTRDFMPYYENDAWYIRDSELVMNVLPDEEKQKIVAQMRKTEVEQFNTRNDSHM